jgi:hypothetical protein
MCVCVYIYKSISSVGDEADGSRSLDFFDEDVESFGSVSTRGVTEPFAMEKTWQ